jgi:RNA polymerase sigma-70 factor (ECF subfamily)
VSGPDDELVERLKAGDEGAFAEMLDRYHVRLVRFAMTFVASRQAAEDVAQETWLAVFRGVGRFEGRSSLQTWLFRICANRAKSHGGREPRSVALGGPEPAVDPARFGPSGAWTVPPEPWSEIDDRLEAASLMPLVREAIENLPDVQKQVVTLRDVEGLSSKDVCEVLSISDANQRVLLHRGRARVRSTVERSLKGV